MKPFRSLARRVEEALPSVLRDLWATVAVMTVATLFCPALLEHTGGENNTALIYVLAVVLVSLFTTGYFYAIVSSLVGGFFTNYYFMYPYGEFSLELSGYPIAMLTMVGISIVVCTLTSRLKIQAEEAVRREQATRALYELNERLDREKAAIQREKDRETIRGNILRSVSHDLRTPLTSISGAASVLLAGEGDPSLLEDIRNDADSLITMVENILSITRIQGETRLKTESEVLEDVAGDGVMRLRRRYPEVSVELELSGEVLLVPMDAILIRQVIFNLLENAVRHSGRMDGISLRLSRRDGYAVTEVADKGKGLSPQALETAREGTPLPDDPAGDSGRGMGIGLSVCRSIVAAHGGWMEAENLPEGGAAIRFGLPLEERAEVL